MAVISAERNQASDVKEDPQLNLEKLSICFLALLIYISLLDLSVTM